MSNLSDSGLLMPATLAVFAALGVLSVMALTISIWKAWQFRRMGVGRRALAETVLDCWLSGRVEEAMERAVAGRAVLGRVLRAVMSAAQARPGETGYAEELGRQTALIELARMGERMRALELIVSSAPMLGLLGTVVGMIDAFSALSLAAEAADPASLAGGIWTALTTTAAGLALALVANALATWFEGRIEAERTLLEAAISAAIYGRVDSDGGV
ncbi:MULTISPECIES: MotA/TolQ/ExbB proton channel family protein [Rhodovulum]|uniref:Biopolymer transport protein ExbB n=2 Tax=Rhodovulum TaxID=34008 RepID=A0A8E2VIH8_9RHOB|nr:MULTISPECIES: MotA/TolQ/ExbB proton channel family protein [Rhodovulum]PTW46567.1 biopolymer transport protein ExbB [Rhodovulum kholense]